MSDKNIMVCVTQQKTCERLILSGYNAIENENDKLFVIHVVNENDYFLYNSNDGEALEYLFDVSKKVGADLTVTRSKDVIKAIEEFARDKNITNIIMGASPDGQELENHNIALKIKKALPNVDFTII
ncbi:MAG: universal stress protein UspA [Firmicutes bacterium]|nr:universal stress protein UspA [Bacillota bacterium]